MTVSLQYEHIFTYCLYKFAVYYSQNQLNEKHILRIPVRWVEGGLDLQLPDHAQYVTEVTSQLGKHLQGVVDTIIEEDQAKVGVNAQAYRKNLKTHRNHI